MPREVQQNDAILDNEANEQDQSHEARYIERRARDEQQHHRSDKRERCGEQDHQRLDEGLKLQDHHRDDARGSEAEHEQQRAKCILLAGVLAPDLDADPARRRILVENGAHVCHHRA